MGTGLYPGNVLVASRARLSQVTPEQGSCPTSHPVPDLPFRTRKQRRNLDIFSTAVRSQMLTAHHSNFTHLKYLECRKQTCCLAAASNTLEMRSYNTANQRVVYFVFPLHWSK